MGDVGRTAFGIFLYTAALAVGIGLVALEASVPKDPAIYGYATSPGTPAFVMAATGVFGLLVSVGVMTFAQRFFGDDHHTH